MRRSYWPLAALLALPFLTQGCVSTYMDQKADLRAGGPQMRQAAAQQRLDQAQASNTNLNDQIISLQRDVERNQRKLAAAQSSVSQVNRDIERARKDQQISDANYRKLKAEADALEREIADLTFQMQTTPTDDAAEVAARQRELDALERKRAELDRVLKLSIGS